VPNIAAHKTAKVVTKTTKVVASGFSRTMRVNVAGVSLSHPDRVLFPEADATKLDLAHYYETIADWIVPHLVDRPLTLVRCPNGVRAGPTRSADCFYMKHSKVWTWPAIRRVRIREKTKIGEYLIADSLTALIALVQMSVLEIHTWNSKFADLERPDRIVVDLDPGVRVAWRTVIEAARLVRQLLSVLDLESFVKTTGGRGLHIVVPLEPAADWTACLAFARAFAQALVRRQPSLFTERFAKTGRDDKILVDYLRNNRTNTSIAAYSTRARPDATVSVPVTWQELSPARKPDRFTINTVPARLARLRTDPWKAYWRTKQRIPRHAVRALEAM
jgi:bifunctional non-homologous end joining protein LigD